MLEQEQLEQLKIISGNNGGRIGAANEMNELAQRGPSSPDSEVDNALQEAVSGGHNGSDVVHHRSLINQVLGDGLIKSSKNEKAFIYSVIFGVIMCLLDSFFAWTLPCIVDTSFLCK